MWLDINDQFEGCGRPRGCPCSHDTRVEKYPLAVSSKSHLCIELPSVMVPVLTISVLCTIVLVRNCAQGASTSSLAGNDMSSDRQALKNGRQLLS